MNVVILTKVVTFPHGAIEESEQVSIKVAPWCNLGLMNIVCWGHINDWLFIRVNIAFEKFDENNDFDQSSDFSILDIISFKEFDERSKVLILMKIPSSGAFFGETDESTDFDQCGDFSILEIIAFEEFDESSDFD